MNSGLALRPRLFYARTKSPFAIGNETVKQILTLPFGSGLLIELLQAQAFLKLFFLFVGMAFLLCLVYQKLCLTRGAIIVSILEINATIELKW